MSNNLFEKIVEFNNVESAYRATQRGSSKYRKPAIYFSRDETFNIKQIQQELMDETYQFGKYVCFKVYEPKERIIHAPEYRDKIVQLAINNVLKEFYAKKFIFDSYACIDSKGTHKCAARIQEFIRRAKWQYGERAYIVKIDIKKFFYSINRCILKQVISKDNLCKKLKRLLNHLIDSAKQVSTIGLPLGNTLSQLFANIYLNVFDHFVKRVLRIKYYIRYADDMMMIVKDKCTAQEILAKSSSFLLEELSLSPNQKKTKIFPLRQGLNMVGYKIHATHKLLRNDSKKRIKRKVRKIEQLLIDGVVSVEKAEQIFNSWIGHANHCNSFNFVERLIKKYEYIYISKGVIKISINNERQVSIS